jgi:hypothetical protein
MVSSPTAMRERSASRIVFLARGVPYFAIAVFAAQIPNSREFRAIGSR